MVRAGRESFGLYVHVPFCARKCDYCAFYSEALGAETVLRYVAGLIREMELVGASTVPRTVFFGGGTPSLLTLSQWRQVLEAMERFGLLGAREWTVECNPATVSLEKAGLWREYGINRVSLGVQSLDERLLQRLGRVHTRGRVFESFDLLRRAGFDNINLDLMFALPGQTLEVWVRTLTEALALGSEHLSCYEVIYEEDTPLFAELQAGRIDLDEDLACDMYEALVDRAQAAGLVQYEVANFARCDQPEGWEDGLPSRACRHNVNYWRGGWFYGLGPSASSFDGEVRTRNWANTELYCRRLEAGERPIESEDRLSPLARAGEIAAFGLRMPSGWQFDQFHAVTGFDLRQQWAEDLRMLAGRGWGCVLPDRVHLTPQGLRFADAAGELFLR